MAVVVAAAALLGVGLAQAQVVKDQGTWFGTDGTDGALRGRDINGNPIQLLDGSGSAPNPDLAFVYDWDRDVTWLADWNYAHTSGYTDGTDGSGGLMIWGAPGDPSDALRLSLWGGTHKTAHGWIAALNSGSGLGGFTDWKLPTALNLDGAGPCFGSNCTSSDLGHIWHTVLGNSGSLTSSGPFRNLQSSAYWSGTPYPAASQPFAWYLLSGSGFSGATLQGLPFYAVAVRPGDVLPVAPVPEPAAYLMLLAGLGVLTVLARRPARSGARL